ncbi:hypothetical protein BKA70DRAFT_1267133 [Coprinopsis sp. MPI-PUGE-AT-0042]|nr:hypothetical protein BKA70DRAFT_1267133 [Coprinopsis sp. MPI-PUGE-AT-0042]
MTGLRSPRWYWERTSMMTEYEPSVGEKNAYGTMLASSVFGSSILGSALYGIQIFMSLSSLSAFLRMSEEARKGHLRYILVGGAILVTFSIDFAFDIWQIFRILFVRGPDPSSYISVYVQGEATNFAVIVAGDAMLGVTIAVGDILMLWRCLILWNHKKWVILLPSLTCVGAIVCHMTYLILIQDMFIAARATVVSVSLSVATNVMVTFLILLRLWMTWLRTSKAFPDRKTPRMYLDARGIIVESAAPLAVFGVWYITLTALNYWYEPEGLAPPGRLSVVSDASICLYYSFCALSPQMVIYRVANGRSWKDAAGSKGGGANISQPIQFLNSFGEGNGSTLGSDNTA